MNPTIRQSQAILQGLRLRTSLATSTMYQMIGRDEPVRAPRYNVLPRGNNTFMVIDRSTGMPKGERFGHVNACQFARQLEDNADFFASTLSAAKQFAGWMLRWSLVLTAILFAFAYYGAGH
ncbi:hypothetical protein AB7M22_002934 [Pseudomonas sp. ADAK2 TE3594]